MEARYVTSAQKPEQLTEETLPEIAFIGRSNCGKSSLLNALTGRQNLARHSRTPGRTQMVNFFTYGENLFLVDLPGYGYSAAHKDVSQHWQFLMRAYLKRKSIKFFLFLFDCRRDLDDTDLQLLRRLGAAAPVYVVLTKGDKVAKGKWKSLITKTTVTLQQQSCFYVDVVVVSSQDKVGIEDLRQKLTE